MTSREVIRRLKAGERLRTGYTFNRKAWFDNGDEVPSKLMRRMDHAGHFLQDRDGYITLDPSHKESK